MQTSAVAAAGLTTSLLTVAANALLNWLTGFNIFGFSLFVIIPAGAIACGLAAASGYFYGAKYFHIRPTKLLLLQMVVVAAIAQFLIYYVEYQMLYVDGQHVADFVSFGRYLNVSLTTQHMKFGRAGTIDGGAIGEYGYWLAVLDFIGFLVGGAVVYFYLQDEPACEPCSKYLKTLAKKQDSFEDEATFYFHYNNEFAHPVDSPEFADHVGIEYTARKNETGTINLETKVLECPSCGDQTVAEKVQVYNGRDWKDITELKRSVQMPKGVDVRRAYARLGK